ncbi:Lectin, partial [Globisporangium splendens]
MKGVRSGLAALLCVALSAVLPQQLTQAERIDAISFKPPFERIDGSGRRIVNDTWTYGGSTEAKKHFVRLTTDRQSKKGFLWQKQEVGRDTFSAVLTFRISGLGKRWFGDGIGVWFTNHKSFSAGVNHGFTDKFTGVGIVIDTFVNPEHKGGHKDISIQINDGTKTIDQINDETRIGCDAEIRYHEQSASFDPVHSMSRLKVKIEKRKLVVEVDKSSNGRWTACHEMTLPFSEDWLVSSTLGITGATGALADNHDIIRFEAFTEFTDPAVGAVDSETVMHTVSKDYKKWMDSPNCGSDCLIAVLQKEIANFRIEAEHRFSDLKEKTENTVGKLKQQEKENERRVAEIESKVSKNIDATLDATHENIGAAVDYKITKQLNENPGIDGSGWKTPFALLLIGLGVSGFLVYRKYQALMKSHLL